MPELPEVETVRRGLVQAIQGNAIGVVELRRKGLRRPFPPDLSARLIGAEVCAVHRRSKYLLLDMSNEDTLIVHLGMSGRIIIRADPDERPLEPHDHFLWTMQGGTTVIFNDPRRFGIVDIARRHEVAMHPLLYRLGPEPLPGTKGAASLTARYLQAALSGSTRSIKNMLMDQRIIAGLGNIYVCESLFRARIPPHRIAGEIPPARVKKLMEAIQNVLIEAIDAGGASLRDHRLTDGSMGMFQMRFLVYRREGKACRRAGCGGRIRRIPQAGRSSFYCPDCQR